VQRAAPYPGAGKPIRWEQRIFVSKDGEELMWVLCPVYRRKAPSRSAA
jgi:hypothetical protein